MAVTFDAKSSSQNGIAASSSVTLAHTVAADATALFVMVPYWSTGTTNNGSLSGATWNGGAMTLIGKATRSNGNDEVEIFFLAGPTTGTHNIVASFTATVLNNNQGSVYGISFKGTPTSGGTGVVWADFTQAHTTVAAANSSVSVPNNTANDAIIDGLALGADVTPTMGAQTGRTLLANGNSGGAGEAEGSSYLVPAPSGSQTMNWTFASNSSAQAAVRVMGTVVAATPKFGMSADMQAMVGMCV